MEKSLPPQCAQIHSYGYAVMNHYTHKNGTTFHTQSSQNQTRSDCTNGFWHWFSEMNHAIGNRHYENAVESKTFSQSQCHEAAKEKFQSNELREIHHFPNPEFRPKIFV